MSNSSSPIIGEDCIINNTKLRITGEKSGGYYECVDNTNTTSNHRNDKLKLIYRSIEKTKAIVAFRMIKIIRGSSLEDRQQRMNNLLHGFTEKIAEGQYQHVQVNEDGNIVSRVGEVVDEQPPTQDEDQQLEIRKQELNEKEQELNEREDECKKRKLELDNRDEENKKCKLELDNREKELDKRKEENDGDDQLANKQKLLDAITKLAEETKHPMAVLAVKELEEILSTNDTTQLDQDVDQKIDNVLQRFQSCMHSIVEREFTYSTKEYCNIISILTESHSKDVTTKKEELASNELHDNKSKVENCVNEAKAKIKEKILVEAYSKVVEEGESSLKEIDTQLKNLYSNANEALKEKYNDKLSAIMKTETDDEITLEEDEKAKAEWNDYIEKDHFANY